MTTTTTSAFDAILATARTAAAAGDTLRARRYFRNATEIDPTCTEAWLGLAAATAVLAERRSIYEQALALDPGCSAAREGIEQIDPLLAAGVLIKPQARAAAPTATLHAAHPPPALPAALNVDLPAVTRRPRGGQALGLALVALTGLVVMGVLTTLGIFVFTSFWGLMLAFVAGPSVSELMVRLTARWRKGLRGKPLMAAAAVGMILGGVAALALGGVLLATLGAPLPAEAVDMAREIGVGTAPSAVLLNNPGLLVFVSSALGATMFRMR